MAKLNWRRRRLRDLIIDNALDKSFEEAFQRRMRIGVRQKTESAVIRRVSKRVLDNFIDVKDKAVRFRIPMGYQVLRKQGPR